MCRKTKSGEGYRKLVEYGDGLPLDAGILWNKNTVYAVFWGVRGPMNDAEKVAAAVARVLASALEGHKWPKERPDSVRRQVIPGDSKCLDWALSGVEGKCGQAAADEVRRALTEGGMAQRPDSGWAQRVMRDASARICAQYRHKVRTGESWGGACEVGRWEHQRGYKIAIYREWGAERVYRKMVEVEEGGRAAAALLWSRQGGGHYELLWPPEEEGGENEVEGDNRETTDVEEVELEVEMVTGGDTAPPPTTHSTNLPNTGNNRHHPTWTTNRPTTSHEWHARKRRPPKRRPRPAPTPTTPTPTDHHETHQPPSITYGTLTIANTNAANTYGTIHTTNNTTNDWPRCRHLQHPYHHHHDPGTN